MEEGCTKKANTHLQKVYSHAIKAIENLTGSEVHNIKERKVFLRIITN